MDPPLTTALAFFKATSATLNVLPGRRWNILEFIFPEIIRLFIPNPAIVRFLSTVISPLVSVITWFTNEDAKVTIEPAGAHETTSLRDPGPLSFVFVTMLENTEIVWTWLGAAFPQASVRCHVRVIM